MTNDGKPPGPPGLLGVQLLQWQLENWSLPERTKLALSLPAPEVLWRRLDRLGPCTETEKQHLLFVVEELQLGATEGSAALIRHYLAQAVREDVEVLEEIETWQEGDQPSPRWPSGIAKLDKQHAGGMYGVCAVVASEKIGKSMLAVGAAIEAARSGWQVFFVNAENPAGAMRQRIAAYTDDLDRALVQRNLRVFQARPGLTAWSVSERAAGAVEDDCTRLLVVIDSLNTCAEFALMGKSNGHPRSRDYFAALRHYCCLAMLSRRDTSGAVSWLLVSEVNQKGGAKGGKLDYVADLNLRLDAGDEADAVVIWAKSARETRSGRVGVYTRDFASQRFVGG